MPKDEGTKRFFEFLNNLPKGSMIILKTDSNAFPKIPQPEVYGYCKICGKPLSEYDMAKSQGLTCARCFRKEIRRMRKK